MRPAVMLYLSMVAAPPRQGSCSSSRYRGPAGVAAVLHLARTGLDALLRVVAGLDPQSLSTLHSCPWRSPVRWSARPAAAIDVRLAAVLDAVGLRWREAHSVPDIAEGLSQSTSRTALPGRAFRRAAPPQSTPVSPRFTMPSRGSARDRASSPRCRTGLVAVGGREAALTQRALRRSCASAVDARLAEVRDAVGVRSRKA